jgi:hypothetical protein
LEVSKMGRVKKKQEKRKIETDDSWNRTFYGSPTIGGFLIVGAIVVYITFKAF